MGDEISRGKNNKVNTLMIPQDKKFNVDYNKIREIDINAPIMYGNKES